MQELQLQKLHPTARLPVKATEGAGCFDFFVHGIEKKADNKIILYFGLAAAVPEGYVMTFQPRSSFTHKGWVMANSPGQIDSDYRGELQVRMETFLQYTRIINEDTRGWWDKNFWKIPHNKVTYHINYPEIPYKIGDRCIQAKLEKIEPVELVEVKELSKTSREGGFGSTGK